MLPPGPPTCLIRKHMRDECSSHQHHVLKGATKLSKYLLLSHCHCILNERLGQWSLLWVSVNKESIGTGERDRERTLENNNNVYFLESCHLRPHLRQLQTPLLGYLFIFIFYFFGACEYMLKPGFGPISNKKSYMYYYLETTLK